MAFYRLVRIKAIKRFLKNQRKIAKSWQERLVLDLSFSMKFKLSAIYEKNLERSEFIIGNFMKEIRGNLFLNEKVMKYLSRVINIQRQWRMIYKKKRLFMGAIKKMWNEDLIISYYELLSEQNRDQNKIATLDKKLFIFVYKMLFKF